MTLSAGHTLIELVIVAAILAIIGVVSVGLFLTSLSGGGKSASINEVRANGDYAITQMERMIRGAVRLEGTCDVNVPTITILNPDGGTTIFATTAELAIASNSGLLTSPEVEVVGVVDFDCQSSNSGSPGSVAIHFILQKANTTSDRPEFSQAEFATQVQLRTY